MLGRKRRHKRMEIERMADRKRGRTPERSAEQAALTRRTFVFKGLAASSFVALTGRLWQLQIRDHEQLKEQGTAYQMRPFPLSAARGLIYDRQGQLLANNQTNWSVAIVPVNLPDANTQLAERQAVFTTLTKALGMSDIAVVVPKELSQDRNEREDIYTRLAAALSVPVEQVRDPVEQELWAASGKGDKRKKRAFVPEIKVPDTKDDLPPERIEAVRTLATNLPSPCVRVVNPIAHQVMVEGAYDPYTPLIVKQGIPKDLALGIEANRLYLPGVQIDSSALSRHYFVGEELGHVLGYTGPISREEYDAVVQRDKDGHPILDADGDPIPIYRPKDHVGKAGLESALEELLRGKSGSYTAQINSDGKIVGEFTELRQNPVDGNSVTLTIDTEYQRQVIEALKMGIDRAQKWTAHDNATKRQGKKQRPLPLGTGAVVALDPRSGEVLALVSLPGYDPRPFLKGISQGELDAYLETGVPDEQKKYPLQNRCIANTFAPGSTLKTFMAAAALQEGVINAETKFKCLGHIEVPTTWNEYDRNNYWCWTRDASHQWQDVRLALADSCDVFFYCVGAPQQTDERGANLHYYQPDSPDPQYFGGLGIDRINTYLKAFGFDAKAGIELANEVEGLVPGAAWKAANYPGNSWSVGDTIITSIGQGYDLVTPLQLCNATAAIANGGTLQRPTLVKAVLDPHGKSVRTAQPTPIRRLPIDPAHLAVVRDGMRMNITDPRGLAFKAVDEVGNDLLDEHGMPRPGFPLPNGIDAGLKTGTAEYGSDLDEEGLALTAHAWCAAFAPFDKPEICVVVMVEGGNASATVAAPVANAVINAWFIRSRGV